MMKPLRIIVMGVVSLVISFFIYLLIIWFGYKNRLNNLHREQSVELYQKSYDMYRDWYARYPVSMDELLDTMGVMYDRTLSDDLLREIHFRHDLLSRESGHITYYPLYNRATNRIQAYILLSAGIDGKLNTDLSLTDTVFFDSWWSEIPVYNYNEALLFLDYQIKAAHLYSLQDSLGITVAFPPFPSYNHKFSLYDYWMGEKDYVIHIGCPEKSRMYSFSD